MSFGAINQGGKNHTAVTLPLSVWWFQLAGLLLILTENRQREKLGNMYHSSMWTLCLVLLPWLTVLWGIQHHIFPLHYTAAPSPPWWRPLSEPAGKHMHPDITRHCYCNCSLSYISKKNMNKLFNMCAQGKTPQVKMANLTDITILF